MPGPGDKRKRRPEPYDFPSFRGYRGPRFTPIPDEFLDHQLADLTSAETKVMLYLFRKTYGYRKSADQISFAQLQHGTMSSDGRVIDRGTGLSKATIWRALKGLQEKGIILVHRRRTSAGDSDVNHYMIRELTGSDDDGPAACGSGGSGAVDPKPARGGEEGPQNPRERPVNGLFSSETTAVSNRNHPGSTTRPPGGLKTETTRTDSTREDFTLTADLADLALGFLRSIGYAKPAKAKRERTHRVLKQLTAEDGYSLAEVQAACQIAASLGARGPELIPHVIGQEPKTSIELEVGERFAEAEAEAHDRWQEQAREFDALPGDEQARLLEQARASNPILAKRPAGHPLLRAAAVALLDMQSD